LSMGLNVFVILSLLSPEVSLVEFGFYPSQTQYLQYIVGVSPVKTHTYSFFTILSFTSLSLKKSPLNRKYLGHWGQYL